MADGTAAEILGGSDAVIFLLNATGLLTAIFAFSGSPNRCQRVMVATEMTAIAMPDQIHTGLSRNELLEGFPETRIASGSFKESMASRRALCNLSTESVRSSFFSAVASWVVGFSEMEKMLR